MESSPVTLSQLLLQLLLVLLYGVRKYRKSSCVIEDESVGPVAVSPCSRCAASASEQSASGVGELGGVGESRRESVADPHRAVPAGHAHAPGRGV